MDTATSTEPTIRQDPKRRVIVQAGLPPHRMECWSCGKGWNPEPAKTGPNKGQHTDASLDRSADDHFRTCRA
ncbi:MAG: hypothetical protein MUF33_02200 [Candidatus Nanopelagicales bacterium]|nr:hypothetical protein [Candidatus Nanopelagicales bacterium]